MPPWQWTKTPRASIPPARFPGATQLGRAHDPHLGLAGDGPVRSDQHRRHHRALPFLRARGRPAWHYRPHSGRPALFFARGAGQRGTTARILAGQYLGFAGILGAAVLVTIGAGAFLPSAAIPYFGLIPLGLGLWAAWQAWRGDDDDDDDEAKVAGKKVGVWTVAGVTLANGGDNIGVYTPVFLSVEPLAVVAYCIVFLALVAALVTLAKFVATRPPIAEVLERWEHILFPIVLIGLGIVILVSGGAFGL